MQNEQMNFVMSNLKCILYSLYGWPHRRW